MSDVFGVVLYTDGSSRRSTAGWGLHGYTYLETFDDKPGTGVSIAVPTREGYRVKKGLKEQIVTVKDVYVGFGGVTLDQTNNRGELVGLYEGLKVVKQLLEHGLQQALVMTDSMYVIDGLTKYVARWRKNNWVGGQGKPVANRDLWELLDPLYQELNSSMGKFFLRHVKGHSGDFGNDESDHLARLGSGEVNRAPVYKVTPYDEWLASYKTDKHHPLLLRSRALFNVGAQREKGTYYTYHLGRSAKGLGKKDDPFEIKIRRSEVFLGTWVSDQTFCIVKQKTPDPHIEALMEAHEARLMRDRVDVAVVRLDNAYGKVQRAMFEQLGCDSLAYFPAEHCLLSQSDDIISRTIDPPQRVFDAIKEFDRMEGSLSSFLREESNESRHVIPLTERLFTTEQKNEKSKVVWKLQPEIDCNPDILKVAVDTGKHQFAVHLVVGSDIPSRNALNRIAGEETRAFLLVYIQGGRYFYDTVFQTDDCVAIYHSPQTQYIL